VDAKPKILLVDDDPAITTNLAQILERAGYTVSVASDGEEALRKAAGLAPDLIILDILMPKLDGRAVLRRLRSEGNMTPVILFSEVGDEDERAQALGNEGADDYLNKLNKPFKSNELIARIKAVLRRAQAGQQPLSIAKRLVCGDLTLDRTKHRVWLGERQLNLTSLEFRLLDFFMTNPDQVLTRSQILDNVWPQGEDPYERTVDQRIRRLRDKLDDDPSNPRFIKTEPSDGYRFIGQVRA
jgi:DNA-binding response OmpR family regulator